MSELTLHSQAVHAYDGGNDVAASGALWSGAADQVVISASAIRFQLPADFDGDETVASATLNLYARSGPPNSSAGYGDHKNRIRILAAADQSLPTVGTDVSSAAGGSEEKTIGEGTFSPALDYAVTSDFAAVAVDITAIVNEAKAAGRLSGGWMVVLIQPVAYDEAAYLDAHGLTQASAATIDLTYSESSPSLEAQPENSQTLSQGSEPQAFIDHWTAIPADSQTLSEDSEPQAFITHSVATPANSQTLSQGSEPQAITHWGATPADSQTRSESSEPQPIIAHWTATLDDSQTGSQGSEPQVSVVGQPLAAQTRSQGSEPQAIAHWVATVADSQTESQATEPQLAFSRVATPANSQTQSQGSGPQAYTPRRSRRLFPDTLFPHDLLA